MEEKLYPLLLSKNKLLTFDELFNEYKSFRGKKFDSEKIDFKSFKLFIRNHPEDFDIVNKYGQELIKPIPKANIAKLTGLIQQQNRSKSVPPRRRNSSTKIHSKPFASIKNSEFVMDKVSRLHENLPFQFGAGYLKKLYFETYQTPLPWPIAELNIYNDQQLLTFICSNLFTNFVLNENKDLAIKVPRMSSRIQSISPSIRSANHNVSHAQLSSPSFSSLASTESNKRHPPTPSSPAPPNPPTDSPPPPSLSCNFILDQLKTQTGFPASDLLKQMNLREFLLTITNENKMVTLTDTGSDILIGAGNQERVSFSLDVVPTGGATIFIWCVDFKQKCVYYSFDQNKTTSAAGQMYFQRLEQLQEIAEKQPLLSHFDCGTVCLAKVDEFWFRMKIEKFFNSKTIELLCLDKTTNFCSHQIISYIVSLPTSHLRACSSHGNFTFDTFLFSWPNCPFLENVKVNSSFQVPL